MSSLLVEQLMKWDKLELAKSLAQHAKENYHLRNDVDRLEHEIFWLNVNENRRLIKCYGENKLVYYFDDNDIYVDIEKENNKYSVFIHERKTRNEYYFKEN